MNRMKDESTKIDNLDEQKQLIKNYIKGQWDFESLTLKAHVPNQGKSSLDIVVDTSFDAGYENAKYWLDSYLNIRDPFKERCDFLKTTEDAEYEHYDDLYNHLYHVMNYLMDHGYQKVDADGDPWDYGKNVKSVELKLAGMFKNFSHFQPNGYDKAKKAYREDEPVERLVYPKFKGFDDGGAASRPFYERILTNNLLYDDLEQGRSPAYMLVGSIFAYALNLREHNNSMDLLQEIQSLNLKAPFSSGSLSYPETYWFKLLKQYQKHDDFIPLTPKLKAELIQNKKEFEALSPEQKEDRKRQNSVKILEMISKVKDDVKKETRKHKFKPF
jgi:hypothetical protein